MPRLKTCLLFEKKTSSMRFEPSIKMLYKLYLQNRKNIQNQINNLYNIVYTKEIIKKQFDKSKKDWKLHEGWRFESKIKIPFVRQIVSVHWYCRSLQIIQELFPWKLSEFGLSKLG